MPIFAALLLSLILHAALIIAPTWLAGQARAPKTPSIEARLVPLPEGSTLAEAVSTEASTRGSDTDTPLPTPPQRLRGAKLHRAQVALSRHLFYPPEAVARGLEGEVILLLTLTETGQLAKAEIARSSGHAVLDQAALAAAQQLGALPGNTRQTLFPVSFRLN